MVTMAQSAATATWRNTHTHVDRMHSLTHLYQHSYNRVVRIASSAIIFQCYLASFFFWSSCPVCSVFVFLCRRL